MHAVKSEKNHEINSNKEENLSTTSIFNLFRSYSWQCIDINI